MHDIDRVLFEGDEVYGEAGYETYGEAGPFETYEYGSGELYGEAGSAGETYESAPVSGEVMNESALATELLEVVSDEELDRFLGNLVNSAVSAASNFARSDAGRAVGGVLKSAAKQVLPQIGQAVGDYLAPGTGGQLGRTAGDWLGNRLELGLEIEGLSHEDRQFETAKAFVRFAKDTARSAAGAPVSLSPADAARRAALAAAQRNLPGLLPVAGANRHRRQSGRWVRRGGNIIIIGA